MITFCKKYDQFSIFNKKKQNILWTVNIMVEWIDKLFCSRCSFGECSCCKGAKAQLFKETWISWRKSCVNSQMIYTWLAFSWNNQRWLSNKLITFILTWKDLALLDTEYHVVYRFKPYRTIYKILPNYCQSSKVKSVFIKYPTTKVSLGLPTLRIATVQLLFLARIRSPTHNSLVATL